MTDVNVLLFIEESGSYSFISHMTYSIGEYGCAPQVGDIVISPGSIVGKDRNDPSSRTLYEVLARYFLPAGEGYSAMIHLVVSERAGTMKEINILGA